MLRPERRARRASTEAGRGRPFLDHVVLGLALAVLLTGYDTVVEGADWWITTVLVTALVGLTCALLRSLRVRGVTPLALVVLALALVWIFVPETLLGPLPTPASVTGLGTMLERAQILIVEEAAPAGAAAPLVLVLAGAFGLLVVAADLLLQVRRGVLLVGLLLLGVHLVPALVSGETPPLVSFLAASALWLVLLHSRTQGRTSTGWRGVVPAVALGSVALAVGALLPPVLPDVSAQATRWGEPPPTVFGRGINPMLQLGQNLRRNSTVVSARYTTTLDAPPYLKVSTLRDFSGRTWEPLARGTGGMPEGATALRDDIPVSTETTDITIEQLRSSMLPVPYPAVDVDGLQGRWSLQRAGQTVSSRSADTEDQVYSVTSLQVQPTAQQMRGLTQQAPSSLIEYLQLPDDVPALVTQTAARVTEGAASQYDRALELQSFLRDEFVYSETAPVAGDYDGNGVDVLGEFLQERSGYCVHFSSAMAVMARGLGIPSRIAVGFAPGQATGLVDGDTEFQVTSDDLHAWPELYFDGVGWIGFEPTPGVGVTTRFREPVEDQPRPEGGTDTQPQGGADAQDRGDALVAEEDDTAASTAPRSVLVVGLGLLALAAAPGALRTWLRRRRLAAGRHGPDPLWREVEATALDLGVAVPSTGTPRGLATSLRTTTAVDPASLQRLLEGVEASRYARPGAEPRDERGSAREVLDSLDAGSARRTRWRARLLPRSLLR